MEPFLHRVARIYREAEGCDLARCCFVFPNKRSGAFFLHHLKNQMDGVEMLPATMTISDLVHDLSGCIEASRIELLFRLYGVYRKIIVGRNKMDGQQSPLPIDFDRFLFWGDMLLADFNDVDMYLADAAQLFKNVKDFKEIGSNYLTAEQIDIIKRYWGEDAFKPGSMVDTEMSLPDGAEPDFWKHVHGCGSDYAPAHKFVKLWEIMMELYEGFRHDLQEDGIGYAGMAYRSAADMLKKPEQISLPYKRYVFVGFNVLSVSELAIFERLKALGKADFYWDFNSPALRHPGNKAATFLRNYLREFRSLYAMDEHAITDVPQTCIIGIPSNIGQAKEVGEILRRLADNGRIGNIDNAIDTAIVLPDEELLMPVLSSVPSDITSVNVTMGFPLRNTPVASLVKKIVTMQLRARKVHGEYEFFRDDVTGVLSHPIVRATVGDGVNRLAAYMSERRLFNLPASVVRERFMELLPIFTPVAADSAEPHSVFVYASSLFDYLASKVNTPLDVRYLSLCSEAVVELDETTARFGISMTRGTFFHLMERALQSQTVSFNGEPLHGLQLMGVLETRALDFRNVIMLSMNERVFPRRHFSRSFIPDVLRRAYGLSTIEFQESIYAYYFYRLISRAENVYLMYDARNTGLRSGEMSRYLYQLRYFFSPERVSFHMGKYMIEPPQKHDLVIEKDEDIMQRLYRYVTKDSGYNLSVSTLKKYLACPMEFYFERVADLRIPDEVKDYMDEGTYGQIVHHVAEMLYGSVPGGKITRKVLDDFIQDESKSVERQITASINQFFVSGEENDFTPLTGEAMIQAGVIQHILKTLFKQEQQFVPFDFVDAEWRRTFQLDVDGIKVNFTLSIDRIDRVYGRKRIVDYKTGSDITWFKDVDQLFDNAASIDHPRGIFQLLLYCCAYAQQEGTDEPLQPYLYSLRTMNVSHLPPVVMGTEKTGVPLLDYHDVKDEFWNRFKEAIHTMFDPNVPFVKATDASACRYCKFTRLCGGV